MFPIIHLEGLPYDQGQTHGQALAGRIAMNLRTYFDRFEREGGLNREQVLARVEPYWARVQAETPGYAEGVRGIADGCGAELLEIAALNLRYEILYHQFTVKAMGAAQNLDSSDSTEPVLGTGKGLADGCTSFAVLPERSANGHLILGQNWDWIPEVEGAIIHVGEIDGSPAQLRFTEAGIFGGKIGFNAAGIGLGINGITSTSDDWSSMRRPVHVRCWEVLRQATLDQAQAIVADEDRACSTHFLLGQAGAGALGLEAAPSSIYRVDPDAGVYAHANHFVAPEAIGVTEPPSVYRQHSRHREAQCGRLLREHAGPLAVNDILEHLRNHEGHPNSVCRHPDPERGDDSYKTVTSVVMDLHAKKMWISDGPPCENEYQLHAL